MPGSGLGTLPDPECGTGQSSGGRVTVLVTSLPIRYSSALLSKIVVFSDSVRNSLVVTLLLVRLVPLPWVDPS